MNPLNIPHRVYHFITYQCIISSQGFPPIQPSHRVLHISPHFMTSIIDPGSHTHTHLQHRLTDSRASSPPPQSQTQSHLPTPHIHTNHMLIGSVLSPSLHHRLTGSVTSPPSQRLAQRLSHIPTTSNIGSKVWTHLPQSVNHPTKYS